VIASLGYLAWLGCVLVAVFVSRALAPWLGGWSLVPGIAAGATLGLVVFRIAFRRGGTGSDSPTALWISQRGLASGHHQTDKLTPDGVLAGFDHDDFTPGYRPTYRIQLAPDIAEGVFTRLRSAEFAALAGSFADPRIADGFTLQLTWRLEGVEKSVWLSNTFHPLLSPLVADVWRHAPPERDRQLPDFPSSER
jgi:hypothetical protein